MYYSVSVILILCTYMEVIIRSCIRICILICICTYVFTICTVYFVEFTKKNLYNYVPDLAHKWKDIGIQLLNQRYQSTLEVIEINHKHDAAECCKKMIDKWLDTDKEANWNRLIKALKKASVSLITLADKIKRNTKGD